MITDISIKNFKGFTDLNINGLSRLTLIAGKNNVGKTNILEALYMLHDNQAPDMSLKHRIFRGLPDIKNDSQELWSSLFYNYDLNNTIYISINKSTEELGLKLKYNSNFNPRTIPFEPTMSNSEHNWNVGQTSSLYIELIYSGIPVQKSNVYIVGSKFFMNKEPMQNELNGAGSEDGTGFGCGSACGHGLIMPKIKHVNFIFAHSRTTSQEVANRFTFLDKNKRKDELISILKIIEPRLIDLSLGSIAGDTFIHCDIEGTDKKIPLNLLGEGMIRMASIVMAILDNKDGITLIDEIENGIYYKTMTGLWAGIMKAAKKSNCQVIATTHNYELISSMYQGLSNNDRKDISYLRLERIKDNIEIETYDSEALGKAINNNWEVR